MKTYTQEALIREIRTMCKVENTDIQLAINNAMKLNVGLILNVCGEFVASVGWLYNNDEAMSNLIYVDYEEQSKSYRFYKRGRSSGNAEVIEEVSSADLMRKLKEYFYERYDKDVELELSLQYETGTIVVTPRAESIGEEEHKEIFKKLIQFQSDYLEGIFKEIEEQSRGLNDNLINSFGKDFAVLCQRFNAPLWVIISEDVDPFKRYKLDIKRRVENEIERKLMEMAISKIPFPNQFISMSSKSLPTSKYKVPINNGRSTVRKELATWEYLPLSTLDFIGIKSINQLVDKYL